MLRFLGAMERKIRRSAQRRPCCPAMQRRRGTAAGSAGTPVTFVVVLLNLVVQIVLAGILLRTEDGVVRIMEIYRDFGLVPERFWNDRAYWQPLTSLFLHGILLWLPTPESGAPGPGSLWLHVFTSGSLHIAANMIALWSLGRPIEQTLGSRRFAALYFVSGFGGALLTLLLDASGPRAAVPSVGASGAVVGVLGALAVFFPHARLLVFFIPMQARTAALGLGAVSLFFLLLDDGGFVSHTGHLGGLVAGLAYSRFALRLQVAQQGLVQLPIGLWRRRLRAPDPGSTGSSTAGTTTARSASIAAVRPYSSVFHAGEIVYDLKTGRFRPKDDPATEG